MVCWSWCSATRNKCQGGRLPLSLCKWIFSNKSVFITQQTLWTFFLFSSSSEKLKKIAEKAPLTYDIKHKKNFSIQSVKTELTEKEMAWKTFMELFLVDGIACWGCLLLIEEILRGLKRFGYKGLRGVWKGFRTTSMSLGSFKFQPNLQRVHSEQNVFINNQNQHDVIHANPHQ